MADLPEDRIAALERAVETLQKEVAELRGERGPVRAPPPMQPLRAPPMQPLQAVVEALPAPEKRPSLDLEMLVGRYGMLALATVLALAAAGTFVGWAVAHGLLGPVPRVILGLVVAAGVGAWGVWLRPRERSFGDSLLGLSLAITHVCAWAAGPSMHIVPPFLALALSAAASVALAGYALVSDDEPLWCVGFGGAAIAPFVTSTGQGTAPMLAAYGAAVLIAGGSALGSRAWIIAARVFASAAALFTVAVAVMPREQWSAELALALPFAVAALGVVPFARGERVRPRLRTLGLLAGAAAVNASVTMEHTPGAVAAALAGAAWLVLIELVDSEPPGSVLDGGLQGGGIAEWIDGALIPLAFLLALGIALKPGDAATAAFAAAAALLLFVCSRRQEGTLRDAVALSAFAAALAATLIATRDSPRLASAAVSALCVLYVVLERTIPNRTWQWAPQLALALSALGALVKVTQRTAYGYTPFLTAASAAALAVALCFGAAAALARKRSWTVIGAAIFAFAWIHQELAWAGSPSTSTLLLVTWYAVTGVGCVGFGRALGFARLRHAGLGLGIAAALLALRAAWGLPSTAGRIGAYLVVSVFLMGIAWWYRKPGAAIRPAP